MMSLRGYLAAVRRWSALAMEKERFVRMERDYCPELACPSRADEMKAYQEQLGKLRDCREAIDNAWAEHQKVVGQLRDSLAKATTAAGYLSGKVDTIGLKSRGLDPEGTLKEAEAKFNAANSRLMALHNVAHKRLGGWIYLGNDMATQPAPPGPPSSPG